MTLITYRIRACTAAKCHVVKIYTYFRGHQDHVRHNVRQKLQSNCQIVFVLFPNVHSVHAEWILEIDFERLSLLETLVSEIQLCIAHYLETENINSHLFMQVMMNLPLQPDNAKIYTAVFDSYFTASDAVSKAIMRMPSTPHENDGCDMVLTVHTPAPQVVSEVLPQPRMRRRIRINCIRRRI